MKTASHKKVATRLARLHFLQNEKNSGMRHVLMLWAQKRSIENRRRASKLDFVNTVEPQYNEQFGTRRCLKSFIVLKPPKKLKGKFLFLSQLHMLLLLLWHSLRKR